MVIEFTKISLNIPVKLLERFDKAADRKHYSRSEALKQSMRDFCEYEVKVTRRFDRKD